MKEIAKKLVHVVVLLVGGLAICGFFFSGCTGDSNHTPRYSRDDLNDLLQIDRIEQNGIRMLNENGRPAPPAMPNHNPEEL